MRPSNAYGAATSGRAHVRRGIRERRDAQTGDLPTTKLSFAAKLSNRPGPLGERLDSPLEAKLDALNSLDDSPSGSNPTPLVEMLRKL